MESIEEKIHVHVRPVSCKCSAPFLNNGSTNLSKWHILKMISAILKEWIIKQKALLVQFVNLKILSTCQSWLARLVRLKIECNCLKGSLALEILWKINSMYSTIFLWIWLVHSVCKFKFLIWPAFWQRVNLSVAIKGHEAIPKTRHWQKDIRLSCGWARKIHKGSEPILNNYYFLAKRVPRYKKLETFSEVDKNIAQQSLTLFLT